MELIKFFQLLAILQGFYILAIFLPKKSKKPSFVFFLGSIISLILYLLGDDTNLWLRQNWFLFDINLFITFFYLFIKYYITDEKRFNKLDLLFFIPNLITFFVELTDLIFDKEFTWVTAIENIVEWIYIGYLVHSLFIIHKNQKRDFTLSPFIICFIFVLLFSYFDDTIFENFPNNAFIQFLASNYSIPLIVSGIFYYINYKLHLKPKSFLKSLYETPYKSSGLDPLKAKNIKSKMMILMEKQKIYKDPKLSLTELSFQINAPKQYVSQILNSEFGTNFNDFINQYRISEFKNYLLKDQYAHYTLYGIAREAGFNSKSSFNTIFKQFEGVTPSQFKKTLVLNV